MAKIMKNSGVVKRDLDDLILLENTRKNYKEDESIIGLAKTLKSRGQLQPIVINSKNEIKAGYRRFYAHKYLVSKGEDFNQIECIIKNGDFLIDNLIENIQRENLPSDDLEEALKKMASEGYSQSEIADLLGKPKQWVSDSMAAGRTRDKAESMGIDTKEISTSAMSLLRSLSEPELKEVISTVKKNGGTVKAARKAVKSKKEKVDNLDPFFRIRKEVNSLLKKGYPKNEIIAVVEHIQED